MGRAKLHKVRGPFFICRATIMDKGVQVVMGNEPSRSVKGHR